MFDAANAARQREAAKRREAEIAALNREPSAQEKLQMIAEAKAFMAKFLGD